MENIHWIQGDPYCEAPLFRREFQIKHPVSTQLQICGLGFFRLYINGKQADDFECVPAVSNYHSVLGCRTSYPVWEERAGFRTYYLTYNILPLLQEGKNALCVRLGNGWYHQYRRTAEGEFLFGNPMLRYELIIREEDGSEIRIESDPETLWRESEVLENNLFYGETHDLSLAEKLEGWSLPDASTDGWKPAFPTHAPETRLMEQDFPPDRIIRTVLPKQIGETADGAALYDCGENISGWVQLSCETAPGKEVILQYSEELSEDGKALDFTSAGGEGQIQSDKFLCGEKSHIARPYFCWHAFRYFTVSGPAKPENVAVVHTDISVTSEFECSNPVLNWLYKTYLRTQLNNYHGCIPSDCPHRERLGYTGDGRPTPRAAVGR